MRAMLTRPRMLLPFGQLKRTVVMLDRGAQFRHVVPVPILIALDEAELARDGHLCYATDPDASPVEVQRMMGFHARAIAYAASMVEDPAKQRVIYENVMPLEDIVRLNSEIPLSMHEVWRAKMIDGIQGGHNAIANAAWRIPAR